MVFSLYTLVLYNNKCYKSFYTSDAECQLFAVRNLTLYAAGEHANLEVILPDDNRTVPEGYVYLSLCISWGAGNALICWYTATCLKAVDIVANLMLPTPSITRDKEEQRAYEEAHGRLSSNKADANAGADAEESKNDLERDIPVQSSLE